MREHEACFNCGEPGRKCGCVRRAKERLADREAELLRVRTAGHGAAHELDNIAVECGLGHSPKAGDVASHVRSLSSKLAIARAALEKIAECKGRMGDVYGLGEIAREGLEKSK